MPKTRSPSVLGSGRVLYLPTARIRPNPMQPRKHFDTGGLQELAGSIRQDGVLPSARRAVRMSWWRESAACAQRVWPD